MPKTSYSLDFTTGRPMIVSSDGIILPPAAYCDCIISPDGRWLDSIRRFSNSGVNMFFLSTKTDWNKMSDGYWTDDGVYSIPAEPLFFIGHQAEEILRINPDARFLVRTGIPVPKTWREKHPRELQRSESGEVFGEPSFASDKGWNDICRYVRHFISSCEKLPGSERIAGYILFPIGEGLSELSTNGFLFDASPVMQDAFREYARKKYPMPGDLRRAWKNTELEYADVAVPSEKDWREKCQASMHWPEPEEFQHEKDYFEFHRTLLSKRFKRIFRTMKDSAGSRKVIIGIDAFKQPMIGWKLRQAFGRVGPAGGDADPEMTLASGATGISGLLDDPNWDILVTPADYTCRHMGGGWESEGLSDSLHLHGKAMFLENDSRSWIGNESRTQGAYRNPEEARAGILRDTAWSLTRGQMSYWMNVGTGYYDDDAIHSAGIRDAVKLVEKSVEIPFKKTQDAICLVIDDTSQMHENGTNGFQNIANLWQRHTGLANCGVPYRIHLFSDLSLDSMPEYKTYIFTNLFLLNKGRIDILRRKILCNGNVAIFGPATGINDGYKISAEGISSLTGIDFELLKTSCPRRVLLRNSHPAIGGLAGETYGDSLCYGPTIVPVPSKDYTEMGLATGLWTINSPGLILMEHGLGAAGNGRKSARGKKDYAAIWTFAVPLPSQLLREFARYAGCNVWTDDGSAVFANSNIFAVHSVRKGPCRIRLPKTSTVHDLMSGKKISDKTSEFTIDLDYPSTRIFHFD